MAGVEKEGGKMNRTTELTVDMLLRDAQQNPTLKALIQAADGQIDLFKTQKGPKRTPRTSRLSNLGNKRRH